MVVRPGIPDISVPMLKTKIEPISLTLLDEINHKIDFKTKPPGALGMLEDVARRVALIQNSLEPQLNNPFIIVFAGDHGIANSGVSAFPQSVTHQMVLNFLKGGAAINVFCNQNGIGIKIVDAGVNHDFGEDTELVDAKIRKSTRDFLEEPAMTPEETTAALEEGAKIVSRLYDSGCNVLGFGEMGIGNTSSAALLLSIFGEIPLEECVGRGTGLDDEGLRNKIEILSRARRMHEVEREDARKVLQTFGGYEIAMMCGAMLKAAENKMLILVDGFIASAAFLTAYRMEPLVREYAVFCHRSHERGHAQMLELLDAQPLLGLDLRLGEGTGCALAYPLILSALAFFNEMASFESAGVDEKLEK